MKNTRKLLSLVIIFGMIISFSVVHGSISNELVLEGIVEYRDLEGGFYEVDGYRLSGDDDFSQYMDQQVTVIGVEDTSPSIYMTKAIQVSSIEMTLEGIVAYNDLEGGFYEVDGYRLSGNENFSTYENQFVRVTGPVDDRPSIYMTKAIQVQALEVLDAQHKRQNLVDALDHVSDSREMQILLDQIIRLDQANLDTDMYRTLGNLIHWDQKDIDIYINGTRVMYQQTTLPFIQNGTTLAPANLLETYMNIEIEWHSNERLLVMTNQETTLIMGMDDKTAYINGQPITLQTPPTITQNRAMIPLRFVVEAFGGHVEWVSNGRMVVIGYTSPVSQTDLLEIKDQTMTLGALETELALKDLFGAPLYETRSFSDGTWQKTQYYSGIVFGFIENDDGFVLNRIWITDMDLITSPSIDDLGLMENITLTRENGQLKSVEIK